MSNYTEGVNAFAGWVWPIPVLPDGRKPVISDGYHRRQTGELHMGVDLDYRRLQGESDELPDGTEHFYCPSGTPALAAGPGKVYAVKESTTGMNIVIDHSPGKWSTVYRHIVKGSIIVSPGEVVEAGQPMGLVGFNPNGYRFRHLHFELREGVNSLDPEPFMKEWGHAYEGANVSHRSANGLIALLLLAGTVYLWTKGK